MPISNSEKDEARKALMDAYARKDMEAAGRATAMLRTWLEERRVDRTRKVGVKGPTNESTPDACPVPGLRDIL
jgi:hypothetical protein